jgi:predicted amidohydrolase
MGKQNFTRRKFIGRTAAGIGLGMFGQCNTLPGSEAATSPDREILRRGVKVASVDLQHLYPEKSIERRIKNVLARMENAAAFRPDIISVPETFNTSYVDEERSYAEIAEDENNPGPVLTKMGEFAAKNKCYVICPVVTSKNGKFYNSAVLLDRNGAVTGVFHKVHPVDTEIENGQGIIPGPVRPPVFETDFGKIGIQICFDANWFESWSLLKEDGAEIVFFPSQFPGGRILNFFAWKNEYYIVSSTGEDARVIDMTGLNICTSTFQSGFTWTSLNLEKVNVPTFPGKYKMGDILSKYGEKVRIRDYWDAGDGTGDGAGHMTIESLDPELFVRDILQEFDIPTNREELEAEEIIQDKYRV